MKSRPPVPATSRRARHFTIAVGALALLAVASASLFGEAGAHRYDRLLMLALRSPSDSDDPLGPAWFEDVMRDFTALGGIAVLIGAALSAAGYMWLRKRAADILILATSMVGAQALSAIFKLLIARPRPDLVSYEAEIYSASFPSGHTLMATVTFVTLAMLLAADIEDRRVREFLLILAWLASFAVGCSRIYLGVHWPSDVLAGWGIGALWMLSMRYFWPRLR